MIKPFKFKNPLCNGKFFIFNKDGSVYASRLFFAAEAYAQRQATLKGVDIAVAREWAENVMNTNPVEVTALGSVLYEEDRESFLQNADEICPPYADPSQVYDKEARNTFEVEWYDPSYEEDEDLQHKKATYKADRLEVALNIWHYLHEGQFNIEKVTQLHNGEILNVWKARNPNTYDFELELVVPTTH